MCRNRKVRISVRMWAPSTSASQVSTTLWYRATVTSNSSPMPDPMAVIMAWISLFESTLLIRAFSTLMILPRSGRIAWKLRSRASTAEPPALSPSTRKSSAACGSEIEQSASLPGRPPPPSADLRRIRPRAFRAARRAQLAGISLFAIALPSVLALVDVPDEVPDAALEAEVGMLAAGPLVDQLEPQPACQEGHLAQPLGQRVVAEICLVEDLDVRPEGDRRTCAIGARALCQRP